MNLQRDEHLMGIIRSNQNACPTSVLLGFNRLRYVGTLESELVDAVVRSANATIVRDNQNRVVGVAPQGPTVVRSIKATSPSFFEVSAQQPTQTSELQSIRSSETESSQVVMPIGNLSYMVPNGAAAAPISGLQPSGGHFFQTHSFLPYPGVPTLPSYYNANPIPAAVAPGAVAGAAGDHSVSMGAGAVDNATVFYRPLWPTPAYPQAPASFLSYIAPQHQSLYVSLLQQQTGNLGSAAATAPGHNAIPRNPGAPFLPPPVVATNPHLAAQQQRAFAVSVRAPNRPPSNRPASAEKATEEPSEQTS